MMVAVMKSTVQYYLEDYTSSAAFHGSVLEYDHLILRNNGVVG